MAQLRDSMVSGNLEVTGDIILKTNNNALQGIHPDAGEVMNLIQMSNYGDTLVGYDGFVNKNSDSHICGNDIHNFVAAAGDVNYRPYYRAGDSIDFVVKTSGFVTASGTAVAFTIPITKPVIGNPTATITKDNGFILRQNGNYTHGSDGATGVYVKAASFFIEENYNGGFVVTASFEGNAEAGSVTNNSHIGVVWTGTITLS